MLHLRPAARHLRFRRHPVGAATGPLGSHGAARRAARPAGADRTRWCPRGAPVRADRQRPVGPGARGRGGLSRQPGPGARAPAPHVSAPSRWWSCAHPGTRAEHGRWPTAGAGGAPSGAGTVAGGGAQGPRRDLPLSGCAEVVGRRPSRSPTRSIGWILTGSWSGSRVGARSSCDPRRTQQGRGLPGPARSRCDPRSPS